MTQVTYLQQLIQLFSSRRLILIVLVSIIGLFTAVSLQAMNAPQSPSPDGLTTTEWDDIQRQIATDTRSPQAIASWLQQGKVTANDSSPSDQFGWATAVFSNTAIIGVPMNDDYGSDSGTAYIFIRNGTTWDQQAKLTANDAMPGHSFGNSVAIFEDTVIIGSPGDNDSGTNSGSAYIFVRNGTTWSQQQKILSASPNAGGNFGYAVAIDGETAVIGARAENNTGRAHVFTRSGAVWNDQAILIGNDTAAGDYFGLAVALSGDTAIIGAYHDDDNGSASGSAYAFVRSGVTWSQQAKLTASDGAATDHFGYAVAVDGDTAIIGAYQDDDTANNSGSAYVFARSGVTWNQEAKLTASDPSTIDGFGWSVSISGDTTVISALYAYGNTNVSGAAYVFTRSGVIWSQQSKLIASDGQAGDFFGWAAAIDGDTTIIGAAYDDNNGIDNGSTYAFTPGQSRSN